MRVVEIIHEFSFEAKEELKEPEGHIEEMEKDSAELRNEVRRMKAEQLGGSRRVTICGKM